MTDCVVYVGDIQDPTFKWDGDWNGNVPARLSPEFPSPPHHYNADFHAWVKATGIVCEQTDFGGWVARVTKSQILDYIAVVYRGREQLPWVKVGLADVIALVSALDEDTEYGLVATEW